MFHDGWIISFTNLIKHYYLQFSKINALYFRKSAPFESAPLLEGETVNERLLRMRTPSQCWLMKLKLMRRMKTAYIYFLFVFIMNNI